MKIPTKVGKQREPTNLSPDIKFTKCGLQILKVTPDFVDAGKGKSSISTAPHFSQKYGVGW